MSVVLVGTVDIGIVYSADVGVCVWVCTEACGVQNVDYFLTCTCTFYDLCIQPL